MSILPAIAVYATISRELGLPLRFPGKPGAYNAIYQVTKYERILRMLRLWRLWGTSPHRHRCPRSGAKHFLSALTSAAKEMDRPKIAAASRAF